MLSQNVLPPLTGDFPSRPAQWSIRNTIGGIPRITPSRTLNAHETDAGKTPFDNPGGYLFIFTHDGTVLECNGTFVSRLGYRRRDITGRTLSSFIAPEHTDDFTSAATVRIGARRRVDTVFRCRNGESRPLTVTINPFRTESGRLLLVEASPVREPIDGKVFERCFRTTPLPTLVWRKQGAGFVLDCHNAAAEVLWEIQSGPAGSETAGRFFAASPEITGILEQCYRDRQRMETETGHPAGYDVPEHRLRLVFDSFPPDRVFVYAEDVTERNDLEERIAACRHLLRSLSAKLALAEENQRMLIAADLHDSVNQSLAAAQFKLEELEEENPTCRAKTREIRFLVEKTIREARGLSFELSPPILRESGFEAAAEWLAGKFERERGIATRIQCRPEPERLPEEVEALLFKALRELLHNTYKHARARNVRIEVRDDRANVYVTVEDDGMGFDPSRAGERKERTGGFGLFGIRERLRYIGGDMAIESSQSTGTRCILRAPLEKRS